MRLPFSDSRTALFVAMLLAGLLLAASTVAQDAPVGAEPVEAPPPTPSLAEQIAAQESELAAELTRVRSQIEAAGDSAPAPLVREKELLERVELLLRQQLVALKQKEESTAALEDLKRDLEQLRAAGPSEDAPHSVVLLDAVRDELHALRGRVETIEAGAAAAADARAQARKTLDEREAARRRAKEASETNTDDSKAADLAQQVRLAQLQSRVATQDLQLRKIEVERQQLLRETFEARVLHTEEREKWIKADAVFTSDDLRAKVVELEAKEEHLRRQLELQQSRIEFSEREWFDAKRRLESGAANAALAEEVASRRLAFEVNQRGAAIITKRVARLASMKEMWQRRFSLWRDVEDRATVSSWDADARALLEDLDTEYRLQELEQRDLAREGVTLQTRLESVGEDAAATTRWIRQQIALNSELGELYETNLASIESTRRLSERVLDDAGAELASVTWTERLRALRESVAAVWAFEITSVEDRSITVGKIVIGLVLLILGFYLSKLISNWIGRRVLPKLGLDEGAAAAIRSIVFYVLLVTLVFIALRTINVPLTAFTILGGAFAIGLGFGSQNIMNNFMSGLILIAERPIRVGDLVQIGDLYGIVQHIGARSTRLLTGDNIELVVPNSSFLETNVINWTLSETKVRIHVSVGVAYGSPTREVTRVLMRAAQEHGRVLKSPAPIVLFTEFGDNSLNFEIHFWIKMRRMMDRKMLESDIRYRIDSLFHEAGIVIAFPQRDVHLDTLRPLDVRMITDHAAATDPVQA